MKMDWQLQHNFETVLKIIDLQNETVKNIKQEPWYSNAIISQEWQ
jgi:hypothetical protein